MKVITREPSRRAHQVVDPLAALEPARIEDPQRLVCDKAGVVAGACSIPDVGVADQGRRRQRISAVEALVGSEDVAALPDQVVGASKRVALHRERCMRLRTVVTVAVQHVADLCGGVDPHADPGVREERIERLGRLNRNETLAEEVGEFDQIRPPVRIELAQALVEPSAVAVHDVGPGAGLLVRRLRHEGHPHVLTGQARIVFGTELRVALLVPRHGQDRHVRDRRQQPRGRSHELPDPARSQRVDLARCQRNAHDAPSGSELSAVGPTHPSLDGA